ncbi:hypothetical protein [Bacillus thuringiensis]|uniref:hypothetical protein n=1 Tax=Bacillus thuringiensis TaxID=1428 RepID=UPI000BFAA699|nr:hypothetical protein [Bacillus thuringiensis]PFC31692.1 hypothetical protein CN299_12115 [Bacillus thuringiensis]
MAKKTSKKVGFSAYQIDIQYIKKSDNQRADEIKNTWDHKFMYELLTNINHIEASKKKYAVSDEWFMILNEVKEDEHNIYGNFKCADYGKVADLIHADTLQSRLNPKKLREGEENLVHFLIRKKDGFMLLQYDAKLTRAKLQSYLEKLGKDVIGSSKYFSFNICTLLSLDFIEDLKKLDTVKSTLIEITSKTESDENEFIREMQGEMGELEATHVSLEFKARRVKEGLQAVVPFIKKFRGQKGVTSIKVVGDQKGAEKKININTSHETFRPQIKVDKNNNPSSEDLYDKVAIIAKGREVLKRSE